MDPGKNVALTPAATGNQGECSASTSAIRFNLHQELQKVKSGEDSVLGALYYNPNLTAGYRCIYVQRDPLLSYDPNAFFLRPWENLSIDKITLIIPAPKFSDASSFWRCFRKVIESEPAEILLGNYLYRFSCKWCFEYFIQWGCVQTEKGSIRIEFNPNKADLSKLGLLLRLFHSPVLKQIRVSRIDIAVDYGMFLQIRAWNWVNFTDFGYRGKNREIETLYIGSEKSDLQIRVYNKAKELQDKSGLAVPFDLWRVEAQLLKIKGSAIDLWDYSAFGKCNPFGNLSYLDPFGFKPSETGIYSCFVELARCIGVAEASRHFDRRTQKRLFLRLQSDMCVPDFNAPALIYSECFEAVYRAFLERLREVYSRPEECTV